MEKKNFQQKEKRQQIRENYMRGSYRISLSASASLSQRQQKRLLPRFRNGEAIFTIVN